MSCIVYQTNKRTGITYAYESISYWDKEKKQPRSKRKYIGRVDPETGEIVKRGENRAAQPDADGTIQRLQNELAEKDALVTALQEELRGLSVKYNKAVKAIEKIATLTEAFTEEKNV